MKIYLYMTKQWSRRAKPGMTIAFDEVKGRRVIKEGFAKEVPNPEIKTKAAAKAEAKAKAEAEAKAEAKAKAEAAIVKPNAETADARPDIKGKPQKPTKK